MGKKNKGGNKGDTSGGKQQGAQGAVTPDHDGETTGYQKQQFGQDAQNKKRG